MKIVYGRFIVENEVYTPEEMITICDALAEINIAGNIDGNVINFAMPMPEYIHQEFDVTKKFSYQRENLPA